MSQISSAFQRSTPKQMLMSFGCSAEQLYYDDLPYHPLVTNDFKTEGLFRVRRDKSLPFKTIQHNPDGLIRCLAFDVDVTNGMHHWYDVDAPAPNWVIVNPDNGHAHYLYMLDCPVPTTDASRLKPQRYVSAIERAISLKLQADINYVGLVSKNPLSDHWHIWKPRIEAYSLNELEEYVDLSTLPKLKKREHDGTSRHCLLFDELRYWAYARVTSARNDMTLNAWIQTLLHKAEALNTFYNPLPYNSLKHTAKSVGRWTWTNYTGSNAKVKRGRDTAQNAQLELQDKQVLSAVKTNRQRVATTLEKLAMAYNRLLKHGSVSKKALAKNSGCSIITVRKHWDQVVASNSVQGGSVRCASDNHVVRGK